MDDDLSDLYQEIILGHNRRPRNAGTLDPCDASAEGFNPLCGDQLTVYLRRDGDLVSEIACDCQGCAISRASGSIMTTLVEGKSEGEIAPLIKDFTEMLTSEEEPEFDLASHGDLAALIGVRKFPARVKCAALAWHALDSALRGGGAATTE